jgi:predicted transport protein/RecB family endonuclease NucS
MPLYQIKHQKTQQVKPSSFKNEKELQNLFEANLEELLGVRFVDTEFTTGDRQRGRIDTLGVDQDGTPVIIEYKKTNKENVINQGLFYLDWLVDHKGDFTLAAQKQLGKDIEIDWSSPRLILVAESFSEYDKYAVNRIGANIQLWTYRKYGNDFLFLESIFATTNQKLPKKEKAETKEDASEDNLEEQIVYTLEYHLGEKPADTKLLFDALRERIFALNSDSDIIEKPNKIYVSYKHGKNFCEVQVQANRVKIWLDIPHAELVDPQKISRDVSKIGHHGTGTSETNLSDLSEVDVVMSLIEQSYKQTV